jgi:hypothetical protein
MTYPIHKPMPHTDLPYSIHPGSYPRAYPRPPAYIRTTLDVKHNNNNNNYPGRKAATQPGGPRHRVPGQRS